MRGTPPEDLDRLVRQLRDVDPRNPDAQWQAAIKLGELADPRASEPLVRALGPDNQVIVRAHAAQAFWRITDGRAIDPLISSLRDPHYLVRSYAARALGKLKEVDKNLKSVLPLIGVLENDPFFGTRAEAAEALGAICREDVSDLSMKAREALEKHDESARKDRDERAGRVNREVDQALQEIKDAIDDLQKLGAKMTRLTGEEWGAYWKAEGKNRFLKNLGRIWDARRMLGAPIGF